MNKNFKIICKKIKEYDYIVIARHIGSDLDALGSQFALKEWINLNYKDKKVYCVGEDHNKFTNVKHFIPKSDTIDFENKKYLAICLDVGQYKRIDGGDLFENASYTICIDHHNPADLDHFDFSYVDSKSMATCEILADFMLGSRFKKMNELICKYLYAGIASDSGNFFYEACTYKTFALASKLIKIGGFNIYNDFNYIVNLDSFEDSLINNKLFETIVYDKDSKLAYYMNDAKSLKEIGITAQRANENIRVFNRIEDFDIIASISEDVDGTYRCSIRSKTIPIVEVAIKYGGGGHKFACGAKGLSLEQVQAMINELKKL